MSPDPSRKQPEVGVYVVTYRRHHLLRRALASVRDQSYANWKCYVINDDPEDAGVECIVQELGDERIAIFRPMRKRGASGSFNEAFKGTEGMYSSLLEDDNWWEPGFLEAMVAALEDNPQASVACGNEKIWRENADGSWTDTGQTIWPTDSNSFYTPTLEAACGSARICNSSLLVRRREREAWLTPDDIPVDVTEHFRERVIPHPVLLVASPLVNYAETLQTNRDTRGTVWGEYQVLLVGSVFASLNPLRRRQLARQLFIPFGGRSAPKVTSLLLTGLAIREARCLWKEVSPLQLLRFALTAARQNTRLLGCFSVRRRLGKHWQWLMSSPLNRSLD